MKTSCQGKDIKTQVHLATTCHRRCREELSLRCSLDADASGVSDERPRGSCQLHHHGDVRQPGAPPVCGTGDSRFDPDTSHCLTPLTYRLSGKTSITFRIIYGPCWAPLSKAIASCLSEMLILEGQGHMVTVRLKSYRITLVANRMITLNAKSGFNSLCVTELSKSSRFSSVGRATHS